MHDLEITQEGKGIKITLDGFELESVIDYNVKSSAVPNLTELTLKIQVGDAKIVRNQ